MRKLIARFINWLLSFFEDTLNKDEQRKLAEYRKRLK